MSDENLGGDTQDHVTETSEAMQIEDVMGTLFPEPPPEESEPETAEEPEEVAEPAKADDSVDSHPEQADPETVEPSTILELADAVEVEPSYLYGLEVPMGDGLKSMTIGELKDAATNTSRIKAELDRERVAVEAAKQKMAIDKEIFSLVERKRLFEEGLESQRENLKQLDKQNPGEAARLIQHYEAVFRKLDDEIEEKREEAERKAGESLQQYYQQEATLLRQKLPEWSDETLAKKELQMVWETAAKYGFSGDELQNLSDHRAVLILRDLAKLSKRDGLSKEVPKKVAKLPKRAKSSGKSPPKTAVDAAALAKRARETGLASDQVAAVMSLLGGRQQS